MDIAGFEVITFDCYGTLIDWERGILGAVRSAFPALAKTDTEILQAYSEIEPAIQTGNYRPYREVLREILAEMSREFDRTPVFADALARSLGEWKPFPDTVPALRRLKERYKLAIISNIDDDLFAQSAAQLKVPFDYVITAQQAGSYKPALRNFELAAERMAIAKHKWLHVAESLFHDIAPANKLGIANIWVNRRGDKPASASRLSNVTPGFTVPDLKALADLSEGRSRVAGSGAG
jgi:2-haloacid dehalogenase